jgi:5-methylcytosine-specific restriction endonuclease McrA
MACPKCGAAVASGARCTRCPPRWRVRPDPNPIYGKAWARYSLDWRARFPFCGQRDGGAFNPTDSRCARTGKRTLARVVDHIVALAFGGDMWAPENHQSLCHLCHALKNEAENREHQR